MVDSLTNKPEDGACGIYHDTLAALSQKIELMIGEVVAHEFMTIHTKGVEEVTRLHGAQGEWETDGSSIEGRHVRVTADAFLYPNLFYSDLGCFIDAVDTRLGDH